MQMHNLMTDDTGLWVFDNDGTLYKTVTPIRTAVEAKMNAFIALHFGISTPEAIAKRQGLLEKHGKEYTLIALRDEEGVDPDLFVSETYLAVDPRDCCILPNPTLRIMLEELRGEKVVLTNNPSLFARGILATVGILEVFTTVYGMAEIGYVSKPHADAFSMVSTALAEHRPVVVVDDSVANVRFVHAMGAQTILVGSDAIRNQAPGFWTDSLESGEVHYVGA